MIENIQDAPMKKLQVGFFKKKEEAEAILAEAEEIQDEIERRFIEEGIEKDDCPKGSFGFRKTKSFVFQAADEETLDLKKNDLKKFKKEAEGRAEVTEKKTFVGVKVSK